MNRIIDVFPTAQQAQVRAQLALVLEGVLSQTLIPKVGGGRVMSLEIMVATPAIRNLIREERSIRCTRRSRPVRSSACRR